MDKIMDLFIKEILQNIRDEMNLDINEDELAIIINKWESYKQQYFVNDNDLLCKQVNKLQETIIELNDKQRIDLNKLQAKANAMVLPIAKAWEEFKRLCIDEPELMKIQGEFLKQSLPWKAIHETLKLAEGGK